MSKTTKSPKKVAKAALRAASRTLPLYAHQFSPKKFTQPQLFACLVLKTVFKTDYRGITIFLADMPSLRRTLKLKTVPHFTTLQKASQRLFKQSNISSLISATISTLKKKIPLAAIDATGFQSGHISPYYYTIREKAARKLSWSHFKRWPKIAIIVDVVTHLIIACYPTRGPGRDTTHFKETLAQLPAEFSIEHLVADAGYDSEATHAYAREELGIITTIPSTASPKPKHLPKKPYRRLMAVAFDSQAYRQRGQVETAFSMIKRNLSYTIRAKNECSQNAEIILLALTHNLMIILLFFKELFYRAERRTSNVEHRTLNVEDRRVDLGCKE
jgi:transposase